MNKFNISLNNYIKNSKRLSYYILQLSNQDINKD